MTLPQAKSLKKLLFFSDYTKESSPIAYCGDVCPLGMKCIYDGHGVTNI